MIYLREKIFIEKLFAALKLNGCKRLDISYENISNVMPLLYKLIIDKKILNDLDELTLLFEENCNHEYTDIYKLIDNLDPLFAEREEDTLSIIVDNNLATQIIKTDSMFNEEDILDISNNIKSVFMKKNKVKELMFNAFN